MPRPGVPRPPEEQIPHRPDTTVPFETRREELFKEIENNRAQGNHLEVGEAVDEVFDQSIEDGLRLAERVRCTPAEYQAAVFAASFKLKHPIVYEEIVNRFIAMGEPNPDPFAGPQELAKVKQTENAEAKKVRNLYVDLAANREPVRVQEPVKTTLSEQIAASRKKEVKATTVGETYLEKLEPVLEGNYYTHSIKERFPQLEQNNLLQGSTITEDLLRALLSDHNIGPIDDVVKQLKPARVVAYTQIDAIERSAARSALIKEIKSTLPEGQALELDAATNRYEIVDKPNPEQEEERKKKEEGEKRYRAYWVGHIKDLYEKGKVDADFLAQSLTADDSPEAWEARELLENKRDIKAFVKSFAGLDTQNAWVARNAYENRVDIVTLLTSLTGVDSPRAEAIRIKQPSNSIAEREAYRSLIGVASDDAMDRREKRVNTKFVPSKLVKDIDGTFDGLDHPSAWVWRESKMLSGNQRDLEDVALSLKGLDSSQAWDIRHRLQIMAMYQEALVVSVTGLDSEKAWVIRDAAFIIATHKKDTVLLDHIVGSLATLHSQRAMDMRNLLEKEGADPERLLRSWLGDRDTILALRASAHMREASAEKKETKTEFLDEEKALDHIQECMAMGNRMGNYEFYVKALRALAGFDGPLAESLQKGAFIEGAKLAKTDVDHIRIREAHAASLMGKNGPDIGRIRKNLVKKGEYDALAHMLIGLDDPEAESDRLILSKTGNAHALATSLIGLDTQSAKRHRWHLSQLSQVPFILLRSCAGVDSPETWQWREDAFKTVQHIEELLYSLRGLDTPRSWVMRKAFERSNDLATIQAVLGSLIGLSSNEARDMRERIFKSVYTTKSPVWVEVSPSTVGLDTPEAKDIRAKELKQCLPGEAIEKVLEWENGGPEEAAIWRLLKNVQEIKTGAIILPTREEERKLDLLNTVHDPSKQALETYRSTWPDMSQQPMGDPKFFERNLFQKSQFAADTLTGTSGASREDIEQYLATNPAVPDRAPERLADELFYRMRPEQRPRLSRWDSLKGALGRFGSRGEERPDVSDVFADTSAHELIGAGAEDIADKRKVLEARDELHEMLVTGAYGKYNKENRRWEKVYFPVAKPTAEPTRETTITLQNVTGTGRASLPLPLSATLVVERVKGITKKGKEVSLTPTVNALGEASVDIPGNVAKLAYSMELPLAPEPMSDPGDREFSTFVKGVEKKYGADMTAHLARLPAEVTAKLRAPEFNALSPKEKVQRVQEMSRELGFYDVNNQEASQEKRGKTPEEQIAICEERLEHLRRTSKENLRGKKFAGVCADYALITATMLRTAGIPAGVLSGIGMNGKEATMGQLHATAFVPWPDGRGGIRIISVDGTPGSNDPRVERAAQPLLSEGEKKSTEDIAKETAEAHEFIATLLEAAKAGDEEAIRKLTNGKLENALNVILQYEVKRSHLHGLQGMLDAYWYGGVQRMDHRKADIELRTTMEDLLSRAKSDAPTSDEAAGTRLLETVRTFLKRFEKSGEAATREEGLALLEHIGDLAKNELSEVERRAYTVVIEYLKAKKVQ